MINFKKIALIQNAEGAEKKISTMTANEVQEVFNQEKLQYKLFRFDSHLVSNLQSYQPDVAFLATHGKFGEEGILQGLLESLKIPYTGSGVLGSALCMNKIHFKKWIHAHGFLSAKALFLEIKGDQIFIKDVEGTQYSDLLLISSNKKELSVKELEERLTFPLVVKPNQSGSSLGISICYESKNFSQCIKEAQEYDSHILIEEFIKGKEIGSPWFKGASLTPIEIQPEEGHFYDYERKYYSSNTTYTVPARLNLDVIKKIEVITNSVCNICHVHSYGRVDFIVTDKNEIYILENNTLPGLTLHSLLPKSAAYNGINYKKVVLGILEDAILHN